MCLKCCFTFRKSHLVRFLLFFSSADLVFSCVSCEKRHFQCASVFFFLKWVFNMVLLTLNNSLLIPIYQFSIYQLVPMFWDESGAEKWLAFLYYDRCLKPICCPSHILLKGCPWEPLIWWTLSNSFVQTKRLGKVNHLPQPRGLGWFFVCESSKA